MIGEGELLDGRVELLKRITLLGDLPPSALESLAGRASSIQRSRFRGLPRRRWGAGRRGAEV